jgi:hypothetical protein
MGEGQERLKEKIEGGDHKGSKGSKLCDVACTGLGKRGNGYVEEEEGSS